MGDQSGLRNQGRTAARAPCHLVLRIKAKELVMLRMD